MFLKKLRELSSTPTVWEAVLTWENCCSSTSSASATLALLHTRLPACLDYRGPALFVPRLLWLLITVLLLLRRPTGSKLTKLKTGLHFPIRVHSRLQKTKQLYVSMLNQIMCSIIVNVWEHASEARVKQRNVYCTHSSQMATQKRKFQANFIKWVLEAN